jgi:hypothetical protein
VAAFFDAFEINGKFTLSEFPLLESLDSIPLNRGEIHFRWNRPGTLLAPGSTGTWGLTLDLLTSSNRHRGSMSIHRLYHERPLQLEVNLLISEFPMALADALDRVVSRSAGMVPHVDDGKGLVEAQAG